MPQQHFELFANKCGLCILDVQEKLSAAMPEKVLKGTLRNCLNLIEAARVLGMPIIMSEQFPQGLGRTLPVIGESVLRFPREQVLYFDKVQFCCTGIPTFDSWIRQSGRPQWILTGMETHVCVYQTARGLSRAGYEIFIPRDAVVSRTMANWEIGLDLLEHTGALLTCTESAIFDLLKRADTEEFQVISKIIK